MKALIVKTGTMESNRDGVLTPQLWAFDCMGKINGIEMGFDGGITLYAGYTVQELEYICRIRDWWNSISDYDFERVWHPEIVCLEWDELPADYKDMLSLIYRSAQRPA